MSDRVTSYAEKVCSGQVIAGKFHRLACQRHLNDLKRQNTEDFPYYWDCESSERILEYAEILTIAEGDEPKPLRLMEWQAFDIGCTFGWKKSANHKRRFRRRYKSISRQQGKSMENGILGTYIAGFSGYHHGKLFTAAPKRKQSKIAWEEMAKFIQADSDLAELFRIQEYKHLITALNTNCTIEAVSRDSGADDGFRPIFCSLDEMHQMRDNSIYKAMYNGTRSLPETLISMITTRGKRLNSFCYEIDKYARDILMGVHTANDFFADIYCLDDEDDIWDERNWIKACPFTCADPQRMEILRQDAQTARDMGGDDLADFLCKSLNLWVKNTNDQFINPEAWKLCASRQKIQEIAQIYKQCFVGVDLSSSGDLTSIALLFPMENDRYYLYSHSFMPRGRLAEHQETDLAPYALWERQGLLTVTGGEMDFMNDYKFIISHLAKLKERLGLEFLGIGIDPHNAGGVMEDLEAFGCPVVAITQSARNLNDATCAVQLQVKGRKFEYDQENELLTWSMVNAAVVANSFGEIKVDKKRRNGRKEETKRIDPVDAVIDAYALMMLNGATGAVNLDESLESFLKLMNWK